MSKEPNDEVAEIRAKFDNLLQRLKDVIRGLEGLHKQSADALELSQARVAELEANETRKDAELAVVDALVAELLRHLRLGLEPSVTPTVYEHFEARVATYQKQRTGETP